MRTVVYQSFRTANVPAWIERCLASTRAWAQLHSFDYHFVDDRMFAYAPDWYREKVAGDVLLVSDLARLAIARELLGQGYDRAIWVDADVLVFTSQRLTIDVTEQFAFCRELWVEPNESGGLRVKQRVNNAVCVFCRGNALLDFYMHACESIVRGMNTIDRFAVGTRFLTELHKLVPFRLLETIGLFSPVLLAHVALDRTAGLAAFREQCGTPLFAANLCSSFRDTTVQGIPMTDKLFERVIERLLGPTGEVFSR